VDSENVDFFRRKKERCYQMARNPRRPPKKRGRGRPSSYTPEIVQKIVDSLELGLSMKYACLANGVTAETFNNWQADHPELEQIAAEAKAKFIQAHLQNIKQHARDQWTASAWLLERTQAEEFSKPEVRLQMLQINGEANKPNTDAIWLTPTVSADQPALPDITEADLEPPHYQQHVAQLPAPSASSPRLREAEARKADATTPSHPVEVPLEIVPEPGMAKLAAKMNAYADDVGVIGQRLRDRHSTQFEPGAKIVAARPTPGPSPGYNQNGERPMLCDSDYFDTSFDP
jgi:hypothetical protein